jgi:hypothetical protein
LLACKRILSSRHFLLLAGAKRSDKLGSTLLRHRPFWAGDACAGNRRRLSHRFFPRAGSTAQTRDAIGSELPEELAGCIILGPADALLEATFIADELLATRQSNAHAATSLLFFCEDRAAVARAGTAENKTVKPSAIVGCANIASRRKVYGCFPSIAACTTAISSPPSAPKAVNPRISSFSPLTRAFRNPRVSESVTVRRPLAIVIVASRCGSKTRTIVFVVA